MDLAPLIASLRAEKFKKRQWTKQSDLGTFTNEIDNTES